MRMMLLILVHHANLENLVRNSHSLPARFLLPSHLLTGLVSLSGTAADYHPSILPLPFGLTSYD
jgi:hypothetical protein